MAAGGMAKDRRVSGSPHRGPLRPTGVPPKRPPSPPQQGSAGLWVALLLLFFGYGTGVAVWQGTCMQLFSDLWRHDPHPAFAALKLQSGAASTVAFFVFPKMSPQAAVRAGATGSEHVV